MKELTVSFFSRKNVILLHSLLFKMQQLPVPDGNALESFLRKLDYSGLNRERCTGLKEFDGANTKIRRSEVGSTHKASSGS